MLHTYMKVGTITMLNNLDTLNARYEYGFGELTYVVKHNTHIKSEIRYFIPIVIAIGDKFISGSLVAIHNFNESDFSSLDIRRCNIKLYISDKSLNISQQHTVDDMLGDIDLTHYYHSNENATYAANDFTVQNAQEYKSELPSRWKPNISSEVLSRQMLEEIFVSEK